MPAVRFLRKTSVPGGPLYHQGEVADLVEMIAARAVSSGNAERVQQDEPVAQADMDQQAGSLGNVGHAYKRVKR